MLFTKAWRTLAKWHLEFESVELWPLTWVETPGVPLSYEVTKMKLSKDKTSLRVNDWLTLADIPPEVARYRLGNRSALEWVVDQYQVSEDTRSSIKSDPNRLDDEEYIVRLVRLAAGLPVAAGARGVGVARPERSSKSGGAVQPSAGAPGGARGAEGDDEARPPRELPRPAGSLPARASRSDQREAEASLAATDAS